MKKSNKICKIQLKTSIKSIVTYYSILIGLLILTLIQKFMFPDYNTQVNGIDSATVIFIFIVALNSFKSSFYFSQGNNISRKSFYWGNIKYGIIISAVLVFIDVIINRVYNIFMSCPTIFDMIYGQITYCVNASWKLTLDHSISNLLGTCVWTFALYVFVFMMGLLITMIYFRLNKLGQIIISCIPIILIIFVNNFPHDIYNKVCIFIENAFGISENPNPYITILTFSILSILVMGVQYLLIKKAVTDKN
ncbi:hypothetical protein AAGC94_02420 [Clostridium sporogenes]|uniref:ABC transporter permease n=1 Tax=Clostridium botulinum TaxID=1491 RepID=A0AAU8YTC5_CLOBO|nr:hypothetical protein [Clostridium sporogenes]AVP63613.1 hypothetical protein C3B64_04780 [Clostridium botulinum]KOY65106.1 hypothetical protein AN649_15415 [Clostridium sporogenes]MCF4016342.1 hypothetical protein [Clostridium sporogenes]MCW6060903.1 hypothetical protein [Clostridium sporogenes]MCW6068751.1 hypothetical protein [Clostridium sporogenes]